MLIRTLAAAASVLALTACSTPAAALGSLVDINVVDRVTGETLPMYWHDGRWWVPGKPGNRYAVSLTNRSGGRTLNVISVDGVNVVSGETAAHDQTGYVLNNGQFAQITDETSRKFTRPPLLVPEMLWNGHAPVYGEGPPTSCG
jgi:hypothetical protein